ncbi:hypothetical protein PGTUg99_023529 [Puccinia graminis f. sp. tritici]|uniref:PUM-HD domain-containing protein n=1 Tax=Puccinia graminis f. sp. tritici TaxID=56615 RepID=A0A5B0LQL6_PUCGR|nr:hypothetical protein PGTUg99_023529 [Puccinia graminis f. sp. tritici]
MVYTRFGLSYLRMRRDSGSSYLDPFTGGVSCLLLNKFPLPDSSAGSNCRHSPLTSMTAQNKDQNQPSNLSNESMPPGKPPFADRRLSVLTAGASRASPEVTMSSANCEPVRSVGAIGSSRPGSRIADHGQAHFGQISNTALKNSVWPEAAEAAGRVASSNPRDLPPTRDQPSAAICGSISSGGYALSSSMWAAPAPSGASHPAHQDKLNNHNGFSTNRSAPLLKERDPHLNPPRQQPEPVSLDRPNNSPPDHASNAARPSADHPLSRVDGNAILGSPALSFTQTSSAPSTGRSFLAPDGGGSHPKNRMFNGYSMSPDENNPYSHPLKKLDARYPSPHTFAFDHVSSEPTWSLPMSFGEEAFYSKSNVTKSKNPSVESGLRPKSPGVWKPLDAPLPLSHCSPPTDNSRPSLASPLAVQSHTNELVSQLLLRIEQLERKTVKQDQEIHQLKANISLVGAQSQREHQANVKLVNNVPSGSNFSANLQTGNTFPSPLHTRLVPLGNPSILNNPNVGAGLNTDTNLNNGLPLSQNNAVPLPPRQPDETSGPIVPGVNPVVVSGFPQRQFGPLDYSTLRVNPIGTGTTMIPPSLQNPAPSHGAPPSNAPGIVNYRALLAGDTDCDYEYFIRRITKHNDQQASIFMQQKLKQSALTQSTGVEKNPTDPLTRHTEKPRQEITRLVIEYSLELMTNRFGNFLVSRAIEHATSGERLELAERICGQIVTLAQDTFATHCLQKMIDVDEEGENHVRRMVSQELLKKKETVTHKSAGHVWARLLSVGGGSSSTISLSTGNGKATGLNQYGDGAGKSGGLERSLNELLKGEWAATAKDEVGSLIVQSVLENWNETAKADVVEELLADIYSCAVQQWGNFVILHLIEHSTGAIQKKLFERLTETQLACELSIDNFGAKAIEKVLKVSGMESRIVEDYVKSICEYGHGRPASLNRHCMPSSRSSSFDASVYICPEFY